MPDVLSSFSTPQDVCDLASDSDNTRLQYVYEMGTTHRDLKPEVRRFG